MVPVLIVQRGIRKVGVPVPIYQRGIGTGIEQGGTSTGASSNPVFVPLALLSLVFVHRLFRDPNKSLMGVYIRIYEGGNVSYLAALGEAICLVRLIVQPLRVENLYLTRCG